MLSRIGDQANNRQNTTLLLAAQSRSRATQAQISSGKVASTFQGLGTQVDRLVQTKSILQLNLQFQKNNQVTADRLQAMESSVAGLHDVADRFRVLAMQRLTDGVAPAGVLTAEVEHLLQQATADLNLNFSGSYVFAGSRTDRPPVVLDPAFTGFGAADPTYYQGDDLEVSLLADIDLQVDVGMSADREGFQELIGALRTFIEADGIDDQPLLESALGLVNDALPKIADYRAELGRRQSRLDEINTMHGDIQLYLERQVSDIENIDVTEAVTRLAQDQVMLETAMATISRINQLSLADYL